MAEKLESGLTVLFTGLGCDVAALKSFLKARNTDTSKLFTIDLICYGPTLQEVHRQYIETLEQKYKSRIINFTYSNGVSVFIVRTEKFEELIRSIDTNQFLLREADVEFVINNNRMFFRGRENVSGYESFCEDLKHVGLHRAIVNHYWGQKVLSCFAEKTCEEIHSCKI